MSKEQNLDNPQSQQLNIVGVSKRYTNNCDNCQRLGRFIKFDQNMKHIHLCNLSELEVQIDSYVCDKFICKK